MPDTLEVDTDCPCRHCETLRLISGRLQSLAPQRELEPRLDAIGEEIVALKPSDEEKLHLLITGGSCSLIRSAYVDAMANLAILRAYHLTIGNALMENGCFPEQIAGWTADTARLEVIIRILERISV
jgi:hypothetical protein